MVVPSSRVTAPALVTRLPLTAQTLRALTSSVEFAPTVIVALVIVTVSPLICDVPVLAPTLTVAVDRPGVVDRGHVELAAVEDDDAAERLVGAGAEVEIENAAAVDGDDVGHGADAVGVEVRVVDVDRDAGVDGDRGVRARHLKVGAGADRCCWR